MGDAIDPNANERTKQALIADLLRVDGRCRLRVSGSSMLPTLWPGDEVLLESRLLSEMGVGDIVLYRRDGRLFLHRLIFTSDPLGELITRGDAMPQADPPVAGAEVLGAMVGVKRSGDWVSLPKRMSLRSRIAGSVFARSGFFARLAVRAVQWRRKEREPDPLLVTPTSEVPAS